MPRIAHLTTVHRRTDTRIFQKECRALAALTHHEIYLFVADGEGGATVSGVNIVDVGKSSSRIKRFMVAGPRMVRAALKHRIDVVHFHDPELIFIGLFLRLVGIKAIYDVHEDVPRDLLIKEYLPHWLRPMLSVTAEGVERCAAFFLTGIVAATPHIASRFPAPKTVVVYNYPLRAEFPEVASVPYEDRPNHVCYVGTISEARGILQLVASMEHVTESAQLVVGGSFNTEELEARAKSLAGWASVSYIGWVTRENLAQVLGEARAGIVTLLPTQTHLDSYPVKLFEYMAAGIPLIASDFPLWRDILAGIDCARFVDPESPKEIAAAISWMLNHPDEAAQMGLRGKEAILRSLNWDAEAEHLRQFYLEKIL